MKPKQLLIAIFFLLACANKIFAQDDPVMVLEKINAAVGSFNAKYLAYQSALAHGSKMRKCEKKRQEMLTSLDNARYAIAEVPYYKGDKSLHESTTAYLKLVSNVLNDNYSKIVSLEDIAEQSYDAMEAYIMLRKKVDKKMEEASQQNHQKVVEYCAKQNIKLTETTDENSSKMHQVAAVMDYYNKIYLSFFKCSVQESNMMGAMNEKNVTAMEQARSAMAKYAAESMDTLSAVGNFKGDATLKTACKKALDFFTKEATSAGSLSDYLLKEQDFTQLKKNFEHNAKAQSDKAEIDKYNAAIGELNKALDTFNKTNEALNKSRDEVYKNWNEGLKTFMDSQMPYAR